MPRQLKKEKQYIVVVCEGESEEAYTKFLKNRFRDVAILKSFTHTDFFEEAVSRFSKDARYRDYADITDEIWFFFDVETKDRTKWDTRYKIIGKLRNLRKKPNIRIRLLMTTGCIEYWLLLHYELLAPSVQTEAEKDRIYRQLTEKEPTYRKGDCEATDKIAQKYPIAVENAKKVLRNLLQDGLPGFDETEERNRWLCENCYTFSTVFEAIEFLEAL